MGRKKHITLLKEFKRRLSRRIPIERMILFGSRAKGQPRRWSDFDLIIVSQKFRRKVPFKRAIGFHDEWEMDYPVDFLCYTPEEFNRQKKRITLVREAIKKGIEI